jgi:hypothetical protein
MNMKKFRRILCLCAVIFLLVTSPVFSQLSPLQDLQSAVDSFSTSIARSLPFNSTIGLNWSDAYIGQLFSSPPRFGFGMSIGVTTLDMGSINSLLSQFNGSEIAIDMPNWLGIPLPAYTADIRIGGFVLPFDIGFKFGYLDISGDSFDFVPNLDYMLVGGDVRYALMDTRLMKLSVGLGFNHLRGGISVTAPIGTQAFNFGLNNEHIISISNPEIGLQWQTNCLELKTQVSFVHFIVTPYIGAGASYAWSRAGYNITSNITVNDGPIEPYIAMLKEYGITDIDTNGFESIQRVSGFNLRLFGGLSFNMAVIRLDLTTMYNIIGNNLGASIGLRFQL